MVQHSLTVYKMESDIRVWSQWMDKSLAQTEVGLKERE